MSYVKRCIDTGWVSSAGTYVTEFERKLEAFTGARHAIAVMNGTAALHVALLLAGVERGDEVLMPSLTFVATANASSFCGAIPHFCDVSLRTLGLDPLALSAHLDRTAELRPAGCFNHHSGRRIAAIVPMHTFGHCVEMNEVLQLADKWQIPVVEDAAESLGSYYGGIHTGTIGKLGVLSFNGNKTITTGGGGAILTNDDSLARRAKHITTTAKVNHPWEYSHDEVGFNYRMPNINAALGCAQLEQLGSFIERKRTLAGRYFECFEGVNGIAVFREPAGTRSNYWLNTLMLSVPSIEARNQLLTALEDAKLQSRPIWRPMHQLPMYATCPRMELKTTEDLACRVVNVPSSASLVSSV